MNRIALALIPIALFSIAAKGDGCVTNESPIGAADGGSLPTDGAASNADAPASPNGDIAPVAVLTLSGASVPICPDGYQHPNVCCVGTAGRATTCTEATSAPFDACGSTAETFPDPTKCCLLSNDASCTAAPDGWQSAIPHQADGGGLLCANYCGPGGYSPSLVPNNQPGTGAQCCYGADFDVLCATNECSGGPDNGGGEPCGPQCGACPSGWTQSAQPDLCCQTDSSGKSECFSQAASISQASQGVTAACSGNGNTGSCDCEILTNDGHTDEVTCASSTAPCACVVDGVVTKSLAATTTCFETLLTACGFSQ